MLHSIEAVVDHNGKLRTLEPIELPRFRRVIITILDEEPEGSEDFKQLSEVGFAKSEDQSLTNGSQQLGMIAKLLENPIRDASFRPLTREEIYDRE